MLQYRISIIGLMWPLTPSVSPSMAKSWLLMIGYGVYWVAVVVPDGPGHIAIFMLYTNKGFITLHCCGFDYHTNITPILPPHVVPFFEESVIFHWGYMVCWATHEVLDCPIHVVISMFHARKVFCNLGLLWIWLLYPQHTHSTPKCCPIFGKMCDIAWRI